MNRLTTPVFLLTAVSWLVLTSGFASADRTESPPSIVVDRLIQDAPRFLSAAWELQSCLTSRVQFNKTMFVKSDAGYALSGQITNTLGFAITGFVFKTEAQGFPKRRNQLSSVFALDRPLEQNTDTRFSIVTNNSFEIDAPDIIDATVYLSDVVDSYGNEIIQTFIQSSLDEIDDAKFSELRASLCGSP